MKYLLVILLLVGCEDRWRYYCQEVRRTSLPKDAKDLIANLPKIVLNYLVAPILEKQVAQPVQPA